MTKAACSESAQAAGLALGGGGHDFAGRYGNRGCYKYLKGDYGGMAFWSTQGHPTGVDDFRPGYRVRLCKVSLNYDLL